MSQKSIKFLVSDEQYEAIKLLSLLKRQTVSQILREYLNELSKMVRDELGKKYGLEK